MLNSLPKAVFFDFGGTLIENGKSDFLNGFKALINAANNSEVIDVFELHALWNLMHDKIKAAKRGKGDCPFGVETPLSPMLNYLFEYSGLKFDKTLTECGIIFDEGNFPERKPTPMMGELIEHLNSKGYGTAIISNTTMNAEEMKAAADKHLPCNKFEFVLTSADLLFTKPAPDMFEIALKKTGLLANECIYCGDSFDFDVIGAHNAGMGAVFYNNSSSEKIQKKSIQSGEYLEINNWSELLNIL